MCDFPVKSGIVIENVRDFQVKRADFLREIAWLSVQWPIFNDKMHDFHVPWGILVEKNTMIFG